MVAGKSLTGIICLNNPLRYTDPSGHVPGNGGNFPGGNSNPNSDSARACENAQKEARDAGVYSLIDWSTWAMGYTDTQLAAMAGTSAPPPAEKISFDYKIPIVTLRISETAIANLSANSNSLIGGVDNQSDGLFVNLKGASNTRLPGFGDPFGTCGFYDEYTFRLTIAEDEPVSIKQLERFYDTCKVRGDTSVVILNLKAAEWFSSGYNQEEVTMHTIFAWANKAQSLNKWNERNEIILYEQIKIEKIFKEKSLLLIHE